MIAPTFFAVEYAINPWMDTSTPVDTHRRHAPVGDAAPDLYRPRPHRRARRARAGLPDMVYAANGGLIVNGKAVVARFAYPERAGESVAYAEWMVRHGYRAR